MIRAGLIGASLSLIYVMGVTLLSPFCTICLTPLLGLATGYLASWFDKPLRAESSLMHGVVAGLMAGVGAMIGQMLAAFINAVLVTHSEQLNVFLQEIGLTELIVNDSAAYWQATMALNSLCGMFNLALIIGMGALGGMLWFQRHHHSSLAAISS